MAAVDQIKASPRKRDQTAPRSPKKMLVIFFISILLPIAVELGGLRLTPVRLLLMAIIVPFAMKVIEGRAGRITWVDKLFILHGIWIVLALLVVHGAERLPVAFITAVELVGGYFFGRIVIRSAADYRLFIIFLFYSLIFLLPFALIELFTGRLVIPELVAPIFETYHRSKSAYGRMGLERVYTVFEHPILYGVYCSISIANFFYLNQKNSSKKMLGIIFSLGMTFMSLSSAPLLSGAMQIGFMIWGKITKGAWKRLLILTIIGYVVIDTLSNRTPITILIETLTFNSGSGWIRLAIFDYGIRAAIANPFFGIGFNDWHRPFWLTSSVDNFWLLTSMRYGFVASGLLILAFLVHIRLITQAESLSEEAQRYRLGYVIALLAICFSLTTVHIWGATSVFVMFYLGAGAWIYTPDAGSSITDETGTDTGIGSRSKIQPRHHRGNNAPIRKTVLSRRKPTSPHQN